MKVGIDDLNLAAGGRYLDLKLLVETGRHSVSDLANVGFTRRSVLNIWEDPVTLAAEAALPLLQGDPGSIGLLLVGTETGLDYGKPISSYLHRVLQLGSRCRNAEIKHACYGGTMALRLACGWVRDNPTCKALVVTTDICRRHSGPTELTAGLGATAMIVSAEPRILEIDIVSGCASQETWDVARPTLFHEHSDGMLSLYSYLDLIEMAWDDLREKSDIDLNEFHYLLYHCPLVSLVQQAHLALTGDSSDFDDRVAPSLSLNRQLANIYSGSLYASLLGLLEDRFLKEGTRIGFFSYGSGACAELWTGRAGPDAVRVRRHGVSAKIAARRPCTLNEWSKADLDIEKQLASSDLKIAMDHDGRGIVLECVTGWHRTYRRV